MAGREAARSGGAAASASSASHRGGSAPSPTTASSSSSQVVAMASRKSARSGGAAASASSSSSRRGGPAASRTTSASSSSSSSQQMNGSYNVCISSHDFAFEEDSVHHLNKAQMTALKSIQRGLRCDKRHVDIILGPSGSGKTKVIASIVLALGADRKAIVCVPTVIQAIELLNMLEELGNTNLELKIGRFLVLSKEDNIRLPIKRLLQHQDTLAIVYSNVFLFWKHHIKETIKAFTSYEVIYEYQVHKNNKLKFSEFFKSKISSAIEDLTASFKFIQKLPKCLVSGIDHADIRTLLEQLSNVYSMVNNGIADEALCAVFNVPLPPEKKAIHHDDELAVAKDLKERMSQCLQTMKLIKDSLKLKAFQTHNEFKKYLMSESQIVICSLSSYSQLDPMLFYQTQQTSRSADLVIVDDASTISSIDFRRRVYLPAVKNIVLLADAIPQGESVFKVFFGMSSKRHQFTKKYWTRTNGKCELLSHNNSQKPFTPLTWVGISKDMLASVRDQWNTDTCSLQSALATTETHYIVDAAADDPPRKFPIQLCVEDMGQQYKILTGKYLGCELSSNEKGKCRVEKAFTVLKETGVLGKGKCSEEKVPVAFRISAFNRINNLGQICKFLKEQKAMVGSFRLSKNYFDLLPGQAYQYKDEEAIINPKSKLQCSHAVMFIGFIPSDLSWDEILSKSECVKNKIKIVYQNSFGKLFGRCDGLGVVRASSVQQVYLPIL